MRARRVVSALAIALVAALIVLLRRPETPPGPTGGWMPERGLWPRFATVHGMRVRYVRSGAGAPIVLVHGFASSIVTWRDVVPALARTHTVVALDMPGFGESEQPADLDASVYPAVIAGLLEQLGLPRASLAGNSLGGAAAIAFAALHPDAVDRLILIDAAGFDLRPEDRPWLVRLVGSQRWGGLLDSLPLRRTLVRRALHEVFHDASRVTPQEVEEYVTPFWRPGAMASMRSLLASPEWAEPARFRALLARVRAPTLVLWGADDRWIPVGDADRFAATIPGARAHVLAECGHMPQEERPQEVAALIEDFLDGR